MVISEMTSPLQLPKSSPSQEFCPPQRPLCVVGRLGRKKQKARGASSTARFLLGYPAGVFAEETVAGGQEPQRLLG